MTGVMKIPWPFEQCIFCRSRNVLTKEHIIPKSIGGRVESVLSCKECNESFGNSFEAKLRFSPEIRVAAGAIHVDVPGLFDRIENGQLYISDFDGLTAKSKLKQGGHFAPTQLSDGSLVISEQEAPSKLNEILSKKGLNEKQIQIALADWCKAAPGQTVGLSSGISGKQWSDHPSKQHLNGEPVSFLVPLKIAFCVLALTIGEGIYSDRASLRDVRQILRTKDEVQANAMVSALRASSARPFHGVYLRTARPNVTVQIRLFGVLAYLVIFPDLDIDLEPVSVTQDLTSNKCQVRRLES